MVDSSVGKYAQTVNMQDNPNVERNTWMDMSGCVSLDGLTEPTGESWASFTKEVLNPGTVSRKIQYKQLHPYTVASSDFNLNIPKNAYITNVRFEVMMKGFNKVPAPYAMFCIYGNAWNTKKSNNAPKVTGWYDGLYRVHLNRNLSDNYMVYSYNMPENMVREGGFSPAVLNESKMGVDLVFSDSENEGSVGLKWVRCVVDYVLPEHYISFNMVSSRDNPIEVPTGFEFDVIVKYHNPTRASGGWQDLNVSLPFGTRLISYSIDGDCSFNSETRVWRVNGNTGQTSKLILTLNNKIVGLRELTVGRPHIDGEEDVNSASFFYYGWHSLSDGAGEFTVSSDKLRKGARGCFHIKGQVQDNDGVIPCSLTSDCDYDLGHVSVILNENESSEGVSITTTSLAQNGTFILNVPQNELVDVSFDYCIVPLETGDDFNGVFTHSEQVNFTFDVDIPYSYKFTSNTTVEEGVFQFNPRPVNIGWYYPRIATAIELGVTAFECNVDSLDANMIMSDCDLTMEKWDMIPYIASVPVKHSHYDPKSDFENPLVKKQYKTKKYTGKTGVIDEKITLNLKVPPRDVTTLQGYVEMDKPVPINLVPSAFEGDALNHRGWVELSKVGNVEQTNHLYYAIECDVEYITHNIHSKFTIIPGLYTNNTPVPDVLSEVVSAGDKIMEDDDDFFTVDTDGTYLYDDDSVDDLRNMFSIGEGQHVTIRSREVLSQNVEINFGWFTTRLSEDKSNNVERIMRLIDKKNGNSVFEYVYHDFTFTDDWISCQVNGTRLTDTGASMKEINQSMDLRVEIESEDDEEVSETLYGSTLNIILNNNILTVIDEGFNGREVYKNDIKLVEGEYYWEIEFINHNLSANDNDILLYTDIRVMDTQLQTQYAGLYNKLLVSPFPITNKKLVFTRKAEEGTIYYFHDDDTPAKFRIDPYLQYHNGVDLQANNGIQIFNLNNSYEYFYIRNGLISIGFNRFNGYMFIGKYDSHSQEYITTHNFSLGEDVRFDLKPISDDRIDLLVNDTVFTVWRGHPYIMVTHPNMDINILTNFKSIFGEKVAGQKAETLSNFLLLNTDNLLPACAGSMDSLKGKCLTVEVPEDDLGYETSISLHDNSGATLYSNTAVNLTATVTRSDTGHDLTGKVHYFIDGVEVGSTNVNESFSYTFTSPNVYTVYAVYTGDSNFKYSVTSTVNLTIEQYIPQHSAVTPPSITGKFTLECVRADKEITILDSSLVQFQLKRGNTPITGKKVEVDLITGSTYTQYTDSNGLITISNNQYATPGKHKWSARYYDYQDEDFNPDTLIVRAEKQVTLSKAKTRISVTVPSDGKRKQGERIHILLERYINGAWKTFPNQKLIITANGGNKLTRTTNDNGLAYLKMSHKGSRKLKIMYAGNTYYKNVTLNKTIMVK